MDISQRRRLDTWLRRQLFGDSGPPTQLRVKHVVGDRGGGDVGQVNVKPDVTADDVADIISELDLICSGDVEAVEGFQRYMVQAVGEDGKQRARVVLKYCGDEGDDELRGLDSEKPDSKGLASQAMRHAEAMMKMLIASTGHTIQMQRGVIESQQDRMNAMEQRYWDCVETMETLAGQKHERELEMKKEETKQRITEEVAEKSMLLLPAVVNKITGKQTMPEKISPAEMMVRGLMETMSEEQVQALAKILTPEQQIVVFQLIERAAADKLKKAEEKMKAGANGAKS